jgi:carbamate kinase
MFVVIALGGNALLQRGQPMTEQQRENVKIAAQALAEVAREHTIVITHGNGPRAMEIRNWSTTSWREPEISSHPP